jgi:hypothetical protein
MKITKSLPILAILFTACPGVRAQNLFVANYAGGTIEKFDSGGNGTVFATLGLNYPVGLAFDSGGPFTCNWARRSFSSCG